MLILTSNGLSSDELIIEAGKYIGTSKSAAIITTASVGYKENDWNIPRITSELQLLGLHVGYLDLEFESPERLSEFDVVTINGGNPFFLLQQIRKWKKDSLFREFADKKTIVGISAGSVVLQNSIELIAQYSPEMNDDVGLSDLTGLSLTSCEILPHYNRFLSKFDNFEERAKKYENEHGIILYRLNDGQALFISDTKTYTV